MFLVPVILALLSTTLTRPVRCEHSGSENVTTNAILDKTIVLSPFVKLSPSKIELLQSEYPELAKFLKPTIFHSRYKNASNRSPPEFEKRGPARIPKVDSKDYGVASYYRMKENTDSSKKSFYKNLLQKLLTRPSSSTKEYTNSDSVSKYSPIQSPMIASAMSGGGWGTGGGWGWKGGGGGGGGGHGISLSDLLLGGLTLLSLGGFLLNLLLNLMNLFGSGLMTTTATYPVTVTQTGTGTSTSTGGTSTGGTSTGGGGIITVPAALGASALGTGLTGRTIDSAAGWGWRTDEGHLHAHIKLPHLGWGWSSTTTTIAPTETGETAFALRPFNRRRRPKRETFLPYVDAPTSLDFLANAVLNTIDAATSKYECMERVLCENNRRARVVGQWLEYFMPVYSFSVSFFGHRMGTHESLLDHVRAIALGAAETNCQAHFPRCTRTRPEPSEMS